MSQTRGLGSLSQFSEHTWSLHFRKHVNAISNCPSVTFLPQQWFLLYLRKLDQVGIFTLLSPRLWARGRRASPLHVPFALVSTNLLVGRCCHVFFLSLCLTNYFPCAWAVLSPPISLLPAIPFSAQGTLTCLKDSSNATISLKFKNCLYFRRVNIWTLPHCCDNALAYSLPY